MAGYSKTYNLLDPNHVAEIQKMLFKEDNDEVHEDFEDEIDTDCDDAVEVRQEDSETEENDSENDEEVLEESQNYCSGRDKETKWNKVPPLQRVHFRAHNIIRKLPRPIDVAKALRTPLESRPRRWELIPTKDGGVELLDLTQPLPEVRVDASDVVFQLYTKANPSSPQILTAGGSYVGNFVASKQTKFVTHGWVNQGDHMSAIRDGLASLGASTNNMQLVGHSLGAHVCGVAGNRVTAGRLNRITGMDPAAPLFGIESTADRLDASDASFVQVIHTSIVFPGWKDAMGSIDFYPNGGSSKPGCGIDAGGVCSHGRSTEFFAESITTATGFNAHQCGSWNDYSSGSCDGNPTALMGETVSTSASGTYYLATASSSPYALG
ncbi:pancreatic triacylglycerol lipase-like [Schistocerca piceifrons]|uniref:pancreatic triacylglycerol lipase-like n=1 Tax=Schistocerca piceifrons TaxID=274613 RepID=UPI001F5F9B7A|nr:pancreatic triacylglycerol lipase-like [Schistocerca piceifrons]